MSRPDPSRTTQANSVAVPFAAIGAPFVLAAIGAAALTIVRASAAWTPWLVVAQVALALIAAWLLSRYEERWSARLGRPLLIAIAIGISVVATWLWDHLTYLGSGRSEAFELLLLISMQQSTLVLAAMRSSPRLCSRSVIGSGFLVVFTSALASDWRVMAMVLLYLFVAIWWLMAEYWRLLVPGLAATESRHRSPWRWVVIIAIAALLPTVWWTAPKEVWSTLRGFMPTSGGDGWADENARSGVGQGDLLVGARDSAQTFGPVDTDLFLESTEPTLYDMFNDSYGEAKIKKKYERAIGLSSENVQQNHRKLPTSSQAGQGFSTSRSSRKKIEEAARPVAADEVLQIVGAVPLHIAVERFDAFDGLEWTQRESSIPAATTSLTLRSVLGKPWFTGSNASSGPWLVPGRSHGIRVFNFASSRLPLPGHWQGWHIDRVDQPSFFGSTLDGHWQMVDREVIPPLTVVDLVSAGHRPTLLHDAQFAIAPFPPAIFSEEVQGDGAQTNGLQANQTNETSNATQSLIVSQWAQRFSEGTERGWSQINQLVDRVRTHAQLDRDVEVPDEAENSVEWFLESRRGPDYLFASTTALMLQALDYDARLVTGFYADPSRYDRRGGYTAVLKRDVHVWCEVRTVNGDWIPLEPTPGYINTAEVWTWSDRLRVAFFRTIDGLRSHWYLVLLVLILAVAVYRSRLVLADWLICGFALLQLRLRPKLATTIAIHLLERRARWNGNPRPASAPFVRWFQQLLKPVMSSEINRSVAAVEVANHTAREMRWDISFKKLQQALYQTRAPQEPLSPIEHKSLSEFIRELTRLPRQSFSPISRVNIAPLDASAEMSLPGKPSNKSISSATSVLAANPSVDDRSEPSALPAFSLPSAELTFQETNS